MMRYGFLGLWIAAAHFGLSALILPFTAVLAAQAAATPEGPGALVRALVLLTRILHFPLLTLAVFPREWVPGGWIYVPMGMNSALWAGAACGVVRMLGIFRGGRRRGGR